MVYDIIFDEFLNLVFVFEQDKTEPSKIFNNHKEALSWIDKVCNNNFINND